MHLKALILVTISLVTLFVMHEIALEVSRLEEASRIAELSVQRAEIEVARKRARESGGKLFTMAGIPGHVDAWKRASAWDVLVMKWVNTSSNDFAVWNTSLFGLISLWIFVHGKLTVARLQVNQQLLAGACLKDFGPKLRIIGGLSFWLPILGGIGCYEMVSAFASGGCWMQGL
jgi:hypothetical protein